MKISELPIASVQEIANDGTIIVNDIITNAETGEESILTKQISLKEAIQGIGGGSSAGTSYTAGQNITIENGVISADLTDYARKQDLVAAVKYKGTVASYANLPFSGQEVGDMYNITNADTTHQIKAGDNVVWTGTEWDNYGGTVDLSGKQDTLTAGTGIEINNNVISTTGMVGASTAVAGVAGAVPAPAIADKDKFLKGDGTWAIIPVGSNYTAGTGIYINDGTISVDLNAGTPGITINGNTISLNPNSIFNYVGNGINIEDGAIQLDRSNIFNIGDGINIENGTISADPDSIFNTGDGITIENGTISVNSYIENIIDSTKLVPSIPSSGNNKQVLIANLLDGGISWSDINNITWDNIFTENGAPGEEGAILVASSSGNSPHWEYLIPQHDRDDAGKVLTVQDDGTLAWELPSSN